MSRGVAVVYEEQRLRGQLKKAHRLVKQDKMATWDAGAALFAPLTPDLTPDCVAVAWTALGAWRVLEACLIVQGRGSSLDRLFVHKDERKHRQTRVECTRW